MLLRQTLAAMTDLRMPEGVEWEVLVVDNNSSDDTRTAARSYADRLPLRYVFEPELGLCRARNRAIEESSARYIVFTDDDVLVDNEWLAGFHRATKEFPEAAAFGGPVKPWWVREPDPELAEVFWRLRVGFCGHNHDRGLGPLPPELDVVGANMGFNREKLGSLRFDTRLGQRGRNEKRSDEIDFVRRLRNQGGTLVWVPQMRLRHYVEPGRMTLGYLCRVTVGDGRAAARFDGLARLAPHFLPGVSPVIPTTTAGGRDLAAPAPVRGRGTVPEISGVPRWLVRRCLELRLAAMWHRAIGRRRRALLMLHEHCFLRGLISETMLMHREHQQRENLPASA